MKPPLLAALALLAAAPAAAQLPEYRVPDDPAFVFLGVTPKQVDAPGSAKEFAFAVASGISAEGKAQSGVALGLAPADVFRVAIPVQRYRSGRPAFWLYNLQLTLGTIRAAGDTASTDFAVGGRTLLFGPDPYADPAFRAAIRGVQRRCLFAQPQVDSVLVLQCANAARTEIVRAWMDEHWNDASLALAGAYGRRFVGSALGENEALGWSGWAVGTLPLRLPRGGTRRPRNLGQLAGQVRYEARESFAATVPRRDDWSYGVRGVLGERDYNAFAETWRLLGSTAGEPAARRAAWSAGVEFMAAARLWLSVGVGERYAEQSRADRTVVLFNLKWGISDGPRLQD